MALRSKMPLKLKVNSVPEEYTYVRGHCDDCEVLGQSLMFENNKPFDKIDVKNKEGKEVSYYFDISSFFGKYKMVIASIK